MRRARVDSAVYFDISHEDGVMGDDMEVTQTNESGVQAQAQTNESGVQAQSQTSSSGAQTRPPLNRTNTKGTQATEDKSEEIEKLKRASELEKQALIDQQAKNIERVRQQVQAEAETAHEMRKQEYLQEAMQRENIVGTEAQRTINQINQTAQQRAQESVRQEAHQYRATLVNFAENEYQRKKGAAKTQATKEAAAAKEQAEKDIKAAAAQAKKEAAAAKKEAAAAKKEAAEAKKSEHNTDHKNERTPDNRAKPKQKADGSPLKPVPPFPTGERASGSQDNPNYNDNPESERPPKGRPGRPSNSQPTPKAKAKPKANPTPSSSQKGTPNPTTNNPNKVRKDHTKPPKPPTPPPPPPENNNPRHDTDRDVSINKQYWRGKGIGYLRDQLTKRGFRETRKPDGNKILRADYLREILRRIDAGTW